MVTSGLNPETIDKYRQVSIKPSILLILFTYHTIFGTKKIKIWFVWSTFDIRARGCVLEWFYPRGFCRGEFCPRGVLSVYPVLHCHVGPML